MPGTRTQVHAHRGFHGEVPGNTVPAFLRAAEARCPWIELDVVITADAQVLVSHEPWMDHRGCLGPDGRPLTPGEGRALNIFSMSVQEVQRYGYIASRMSPADALRKPTLAEAVRATDAAAARTGAPPPSFNIEVKSDPALYGRFQPGPERFAELVLAQVQALGLAGRCIIQSFDPALLDAAHRIGPQVPLALLVENADGLERNLARLGFAPDFYGPESTLVDEALVQALRDRGMGLLVWTVNAEAEMRRMIGLGAEGLITDEPARALALLGDLRP